MRGKGRVGFVAGVLFGLFFCLNHATFSHAALNHGSLSSEKGGGATLRQSTEVVFIDPAVPDAEVIVAQLPEGAEVIRLQPEMDGIAQISAHLREKRNLSAIRIISHGNAGYFVLNGKRIDMAFLRDCGDRIRAWGRALRDNGDILLYACNLARGETGKALVAAMGRLTGAHVGASLNLTGKGGDWKLEVARGPVDSDALNISAYPHHLADQVVTLDTDVGVEGDLRYAIANVGDGESITFNISGSDTVTISAELAISGKSMTINGYNNATGNYVTVKVTTIGTEPTPSDYRVFNISASGETINISNMTIKGGDISGQSGEQSYGGGIFVNSGGSSSRVTVNLDNVTISDSKASRGGGIHIYKYIDLSMEDCIVQDNTSTGDGGGIYSAQNNTATLDKSAVHSNAGSYGGGIYNYSNSTFELTNSSVYSNTASGQGGGIYNSPDGKVIFTSSSLYSNTSGTNGAGIYNTGTLSFTNSTVYNNNSVGSNGGGIYIYGSSSLFTLIDSTVSNNTAPVSYNGAGIYLSKGTSQSYLLNSTVVNNTVNAVDNDIYLGTADPPASANAYYTWYGSSAGGAISGSNNNTASYTSSDLSALGYNGGFTHTSAVSSAGNTSSKAGSGTYAYYNATEGYYFYNGGDPAYTKISDRSTFTPSDPASDEILTDQRGYYRKSGTVYDGDTPTTETNTITRGAYQYYGVVARSNTDGNWTSTNNSYYTKIKGAAEGESSGTIVLAGTAIYEAGIALDDNETKTFQGDGASSTFVQAAQISGTVSGRVFNITSGIITLENMTIRYGYTNDAGDTNDGPGILINGASSVVINHCTISNNEVAGGVAYGLGGGIACISAANVQISDCIISNNHARWDGGGICIGNSLINLTMDNSTVNNNDCTNWGGGILIDGTGNSVLTNSTIANNSTTDSEKGGGGMAIWSKSATLKNLTISNNTASGSGGGLYLDTDRLGSFTVTNCLIANNTGNGTGDDFYNNGATLVDNGYNIVENSNVAANATTGVDATGFYNATDILYNTVYDDGTTGHKAWNSNGSDLGNQNFNLASSLADNGGGTRTLALSSGSFAITIPSTAGSDTYNGSYAIDQRGYYRSNSGNRSIGAYEYGGTVPANGDFITAYDAGTANWTAADWNQYDLTDTVWETASAAPTSTGNKVTVDNGAALTLSANIGLTGTLVLETDLNLNGNIINLGSTGTLQEVTGFLMGSSGTITTTRNINNPSSDNIAGLGAEISAAGKDLGSTVITRGHSAVSGESGLPKSTYRYYQITPATNTDLNATLKFYYNDSELNDIPEDDLALFRWDSGKSKWQCDATNQTFNTTDNWVQQTGIGSFSKWTLGDEDDPTLVDLMTFTAKGLGDHVLLAWETASEIDNAGFHLWRSQTKDGAYARITQTLIPAKGGPTSGASYTYNDTDVTSPQVWYYKLEDIDNNGISTFHGPVLGVVGDAAVKMVSGPTTIGEGDTAPGMGEIIIEGTGQHTVTTGRYPDNPAGAPTFTPTGDYWFVDVTDLSGLNSVTVRFCPAESSNTVYYWDGAGWVSCSDQEYADGCIAVTITDTTSPPISDLTNLVFAMGGQSEPIPTLSEWGMIIFCLLLAATGIVVMRRRRLGIGD